MPAEKRLRWNELKPAFNSIYIVSVFSQLHTGRCLVMSKRAMGDHFPTKWQGNKQQGEGWAPPSTKNIPKLQGSLINWGMPNSIYSMCFWWFVFQPSNRFSWFMFDLRWSSKSCHVSLFFSAGHHRGMRNWPRAADGKKLLCVFFLAPKKAGWNANKNCEHKWGLYSLYTYLF